VTVSALVSGGKDSLYSAYLAETQGWPVDELVAVFPEDPDSFLFHTPNLPWVELQARAWGKRFRAVPVRGVGEAAELEAVDRALADAGPVVSAGAIASAYQWTRLLRACDRALPPRRLYTPLWGKSAVAVVRAEIEAGLDIRLVQLAAEPLTPELLGRRLDGTLLAELERRNREIRPVHVAGEGGEFETLVVDAPFFASRIEIVASRTESAGLQHRLRVTEARLVPKTIPRPSNEPF
jgi:diphthine-ammonia ligase